MKSILKLTVACVLLITSVSTYAIDGDKGEFNLHVMKSEGNIITFSLSKTEEARLSFYEKDGTLIYTENARGTQEGILKTFSLREFPAGTYFLEIENKNNKIVHEITVTANSASMSTAAVATK